MTSTGKKTSGPLTDPKQRSSKKPLGYTANAEGKISIEYGDLDELKALFGTNSKSGAAALLQTMSLACHNKSMPLNVSHMAFVKELEPRGPVEAILVTHITTTHFAYTYTAALFNLSTTDKGRESAERSMTRLSRTLLKYLMTFEGLRRGTSRTQNVTVNEGGQAIVGSNINYTSDKK